MPAARDILYSRPITHCEKLIQLAGSIVTFRQCWSSRVGTLRPISLMVHGLEGEVVTPNRTTKTVG